MKVVFVMPHHHNPTPVSLSAERKMRLLQMAKEHGFVIIEDDYDYDFHYESSPILPLASSDRSGHVIYLGSLSKTITPGLQMGFMVASDTIIKHAVRFSRFVDCHGNSALERAVAILFNEGEIVRYLRKALKVYHQRRDHFCHLLDRNLSEYTSFKIPDGGLAVWVYFNEKVPIGELRKRVAQKGLLIPKSVFSDDLDGKVNALRMGFASLTQDEATKAIEMLSKAVKALSAR